MAEQPAVLADGEAQTGTDLLGHMTPPIAKGGTVTGLLRSCRPKQWVKSGFVLVPWFFAGDVGRLHSALLAVAMTVAFTLASSALYLINDVRDRSADRLHPRKSMRPIASGRVSPELALTTSVILLVVSLGLSIAVSLAATLTLAGYIVMVVAYSMGLKDRVIVDVMLIAGGFVLRVLAGAFAIDVAPSAWLMLCTLYLALFLGFGKRYNEVFSLGDNAIGHRRVLGKYTESLLRQFLTLSMMGTLFAYTMYTLFSAAALAHRGLAVTLPFAIFGVFRYLLLVETRKLGGAPEELLLEDPPLQWSVVIWVAVAALALYTPLSNLVPAWR